MNFIMDKINEIIFRQNINDENTKKYFFSDN